MSNGLKNPQILNTPAILLYWTGLRLETEAHGTSININTDSAGSLRSTEHGEGSSWNSRTVVFADGSTSQPTASGSSCIARDAALTRA